MSRPPPRASAPRGPADETDPGGAAEEPAGTGAGTGGAAETATGPRAAAEAASLAARYARRPEGDWRYDRLNPSALRAAQELERAVAEGLRRHGPRDRAAARAVELGCGRGDHLLELLLLGFRPEHLRGLELLPGRAAAARARLPAALRIDIGDALAADLAPASQDLVLQFTVFSSVLDPAVRRQLAETLWRWLKPGGAVVWYDFGIDNPRNPDVRGVPASEVAALFPSGRIEARRLTLAPPIARRVCGWPLGLDRPFYTALTACPLLRTHLLAWIRKP